MANPKKSMYARLASRFAHLALGAKEDDEDEDKKEATAEDDEPAAEEPKDEKKGKKAKKPRADDDQDGDGAEEGAQAAEEDDEDEDEDKKERKSEKRGRDKECSRWAAVMASAAAKGRVPLACSLLADTDMDADKICAALAVSPVEARQGLAARMAAVERPEIGSGVASERPDPTSSAGQVALMTAAYDKAIGRAAASR